MTRDSREPSCSGTNTSQPAITAHSNSYKYSLILCNTIVKKLQKTTEQLETSAQTLCLQWRSAFSSSS